jgi:hypothetical protein
MEQYTQLNAQAQALNVDQLNAQAQALNGDQLNDQAHPVSIIFTVIYLVLLITTRCSLST